jgi:hypothetical protein
MAGGQCACTTQHSHTVTRVTPPHPTHPHTHTHHHAVTAARPPQELHDPAKLQHCRAVAERGLSDLQAYAAMSRTADGGSYSINLKGATS